MKTTLEQVRNWISENKSKRVAFCVLAEFKDNKQVEMGCALVGRSSDVASVISEAVKNEKEICWRLKLSLVASLCADYAIDDHATADYSIDDLISGIASRATTLLGGEKIKHLLNILRAKKGNPEMDLEKLLKFPTSVFIEDIMGIQIYLNQHTLKFDGGYMPKCMKN